MVAHTPLSMRNRFKDTPQAREVKDLSNWDFISELEFYIPENTGSLRTQNIEPLEPTSYRALRSIFILKDALCMPNPNSTQVDRAWNSINIVIDHLQNQRLPPFNSDGSLCWMRPDWKATPCKFWIKPLLHRDLTTEKRTLTLNVILEFLYNVDILNNRISSKENSGTSHHKLIENRVEVIATMARSLVEVNNYFENNSWIEGANITYVPGCGMMPPIIPKPAPLRQPELQEQPAFVQQPTEQLSKNYITPLESSVMLSNADGAIFFTSLGNLTTTSALVNVLPPGSVRVEEACEAANAGARSIRHFQIRRLVNSYSSSGVDESPLSQSSWTELLEEL